MLLFRANNMPIKFDFVGFFGDKELKELTELVVQNGGKVVKDDNLPIKFTKPEKNVCQVFPKYKLYDVQFIRDCVGKSFIVDPNKYRLGMPLLYDDCVMAHYLYGMYECCDRKIMPIQQIDSDSDVKRDSDTSSTSSETLFFENISNTRNRSGRGKAFTRSEDKKIVKFFINGDFGRRGMVGQSIWEELINTGKMKNRTPSSVYARFKYSILPRIEEFNLCTTQLKKLQRIRDASLKRIEKFKYDVRRRGE